MLLLEHNRRSFFVFLTLFSVMLLVLGVSVWKTNQVIDSYFVVKERFDRERAEKYHTIDDADYLVANLGEFKRLNDQGVIGTTDRIIWVEAFESVRERLALEDFQYDIGQPVSLTANSGGATALQVVTIDLRIGFPHDEALFQFLGMLKHSINASYEVTDLEIERVSDDVSRQNANLYPQVNLVVTSRISWLSIVPASTTGNPAVLGV